MTIKIETIKRWNDQIFVKVEGHKEPFTIWLNALLTVDRFKAELEEKVSKRTLPTHDDIYDSIKDIKEI